MQIRSHPQVLGLEKNALAKYEFLIKMVIMIHSTDPIFL